MAPKRAVCLALRRNDFGAFATDSTGKLDVFGHDGDTFGVDGAQVGVFKETYKVSFAGFLKGHDGRTLET